MATAASGTMVASGHFYGFGRFGDDSLDHRHELPMAGRVGFVLAIEPDGSPRWARQIGGWPSALTIAPEGRAAVTTGGEFGPSQVTVFDLAGTLRGTWRPSSGIDANTAAIAIGADQVLVGIDWMGAVAFGAPPAATQDIAVVSAPF